MQKCNCVNCPYRAHLKTESLEKKIEWFTDDIIMRNHARQFDNEMQKVFAEAIEAKANNSLCMLTYGLINIIFPVEILESYDENTLLRHSELWYLLVIALCKVYELNAAKQYGRYNVVKAKVKDAIKQEAYKCNMNLQDAIYNEIVESLKYESVMYSLWNDGKIPESNTSNDLCTFANKYFYE